MNPLLTPLAAIGPPERESEKGLRDLGFGSCADSICGSWADIWKICKERENRKPNIWNHPPQFKAGMSACCVCKHANVSFSVWMSVCLFVSIYMPSCVYRHTVWFCDIGTVNLFTITHCHDWGSHSTSSPPEQVSGRNAMGSRKCWEWRYWMILVLAY